MPGPRVLRGGSPAPAGAAGGEARGGNPRAPGAALRACPRPLAPPHPPGLEKCSEQRRPRKGPTAPRGNSAARANAAARPGPAPRGGRRPPGPRLRAARLPISALRGRAPDRPASAQRGRGRGVGARRPAPSPPTPGPQLGPSREPTTGPHLGTRGRRRWGGALGPRCPPRACAYPPGAPARAEPETNQNPGPGPEANYSALRVWAGLGHREAGTASVCLPDPGLAVALPPAGRLLVPGRELRCPWVPGRGVGGPSLPVDLPPPPPRPPAGGSGGTGCTLLPTRCPLFSLFAEGGRFLLRARPLMSGVPRGIAPALTYPEFHRSIGRIIEDLRPRVFLSLILIC